MCARRGYPAVAFGNLTMNTTGKYWRQDERVFLTMATLKTELLRGLLTAGWDIMMSDVDVLWFESPWPWIGGAGVSVFPEAAKMAKSDVLISTDIVEVEADSEHARWLLNREYNTGIVFFRATAGSIALVKLWRERVEIEGAIKGLYINDQAVFNRMTHGEGSVPLVLPPGEEPDLDERALRGVFHVSTHIMRPAGVNVTMGVLPMTRFCNGPRKRGCDHFLTLSSFAPHPRPRLFHQPAAAALRAARGGGARDVPVRGREGVLVWQAAPLAPGAGVAHRPAILLSGRTLLDHRGGLAGAGRAIHARRAGRVAGEGEPRHGGARRQRH